MTIKTDLGLPIVISSHALTRLKKRFGYFNYKYLTNIYYEGKEPSQKILNHFFKIGKWKENYWLAEYRQHKDGIFVFMHKNHIILLITVYKLEAKNKNQKIKKYE